MWRFRVPSRMMRLMIGLALMGSAWAQEESTGVTGQPELVNYVVVQVIAPDVDEDFGRLRSILGEDFRLEGIADLDFDGPNLGVSVTEGLVFNAYFALEGSLTYFGDYDLDVVLDSGQRRTVSGDFFGGALMFSGRFPLWGGLKIHVKAGGAYWYRSAEIDVAAEGNPRHADGEGGSVVAGLGLSRPVLEHSFLTLDWEMRELDKIDVSTLSLGWGFRF